MSFLLLFNIVFNICHIQGRRFGGVGMGPWTPKVCEVTSFAQLGSSKRHWLI